MMQSNNFSIQESGPDEDHQVQSPKFHKILDDEDLSMDFKDGIYGVEKDLQLIEEFVDTIPMLVRNGGTYGLIWNKSLQPSDGRYEPGEHYCRTREQERKSANGSVSFYRDGETGQKFAIKILQNSDHFHPYEVKTGLACNSPHLCAIYGVIVRDQKVHILLEHAGSELIKERSFIAESSERILTFAKQSFQGLEDLHACGLVHCDVKPDNIMIVREQGENFRVKIIDFGSVQPIGGILPSDAHTTRFYWSPEIWQSLNNGDHVICQPAMDVYALALTLYFVQTAGHLMNMLQEKDILPLMTQRSEDLLLIALPETIPSGLRAVMRPCLAGKAEDRWSAQQAASQLDGDAMMQKALSEGRNYEDLFQQLLSKQHVKNNSYCSKVFPPQSPKMYWENPITSPCIKNESQKSNGINPPVQFFTASNNRTDRQDMGFQIKSSGLKNLTEKRQLTLFRQRKNGIPNNVKFPKSKKVLLRGQCPSKHMKQLYESSKVSTHPLVQDDPEVHYISSDETMPLGQVLSKQEFKDKPKFALDKDSNISILSTVNGSHQEKIANVENECKEINRKNSHPIFDPTINETFEAKKTKIIKFPQLETGSQSFSCSALLITLASQARTGNQNLPYSCANLPSSPSHNPLSRMFERDKKDDNPSDNIVCPLKGSLQKITEAKQLTLFHSTAKGEKKIKASTNTNEAGPQLFDNHQTAPIKPAISYEEKEDEMEFVFEAIDVPQFTGRAEDILDSLCNMLDNDETKSVPETSAEKPKEWKQTQFEGKEEPMEVSGGGEQRVKTDVNASFFFQHEKSRKRMTEDRADHIPSKVQARQAYSDDPSADHLLPVFDKILSENKS